MALTSDPGGNISGCSAIAVGTLEEKQMSIEGVWTCEVHGPFGWENHGVFILEALLKIS